MSTWSLDDIYGTAEQQPLNKPKEPETCTLHKNEQETLQQSQTRVVVISQQEQDVYDNITSKQNEINDYLPEITENRKLLQNVDKQNKIKINNMRIETIKKINDRFNELIKANDSEILGKQNELNIHENELKQHQDELHHLKLQYHSHIADEVVIEKQRKSKILEMNDDILSMDIGSTTDISQVKISFDEDLVFQYIDNIGGVHNYSCPNPPIFSIKQISASSVMLQFDDISDSDEVMVEIADCYDIGIDDDDDDDDGKHEKEKLEWQQIKCYSVNQENEYNIIELKDKTNYSLRARYKNGYGFSKYSEIKTFQTLSFKIYSRINEYDLIELQSLSSLKTGEDNASSRSISLSPLKLKNSASDVALPQKIKGGAITIRFGKCYTMQIYLHYWIWQIPMLILNIILFCIWCSTDDVIIALGFIAVGPVFLAALIRDNLFKWFIYGTVEYLCCCSQFGRYQFSRLADCIGGLHSSLGVTALFWNIIYFVDVLKNENYEGNVKSITAAMLPLLLLIVCLSAAPCFRHYCHNWFEVLHRYSSWLSLCFLLTHIYYINEDEILMDAATNSPTIWAVFLTILTVYPWCIVHRLKSKNIEIIPSNTGTSTAFIFPIWSPMGAVCKLSLNWTEFHVFGITPLPYDEDKGHRSLVLVKSLGDWTNSLTLKAKNDDLHGTLFWIHRIKSPNFTRGLFNFKKVFALATGAGIAPLIPYVVHPTYFDVQISLVWVARDHINTYPEFIVNIVKPLPNVILYDTTKQQRRDLSLLTIEKVNEFNAEAVFIVASPSIAYNVANYANKKGIPIFASNWDV